MPLKISAFPKCYLDEIAGERTMSVFDWIEMARALDADGLEMYDGFFTSLDDAYLDRVGEAIHAAGFAMPMLCCSPDFTNPDPDARKRAVDREAEMIRVTRRLGGPGTVCRVLSGQRYPEVGREQGLDWVVACIEQVLPVAREHDVVLGLENHYKDGFWAYPEFAQKQDVFLELLARDPRPRRTSACSTTRRTRSSRATTRSRCCEAVADRVVSMHASDRYLAEGATPRRAPADRRHARLLARPAARRHRQGAERLRRHLPHPGRPRLPRLGQHRGRHERHGRDGRVARLPPRRWSPSTSREA